MTNGAELPPGLERDYPLARLTTIRTGGLAAWFARPAERLCARGPAAVGRRVADRRRSRGLGIESPRS